MKTLPLCLAGLVAAAVNCPGFDLTARFVTRTSPAGSTQIPYFLEGYTKYTLNLAFHTVVSSDGGVTTFLFNQLEGATLVMKASPLSPPVAFNQHEAYAKAALKTLAKDDQEVTPRPPEGGVSLSMTTGGEPPVRAESLTFVYDYELPGRRFTQAVAFVNYSRGQQIMLILTAPSASFEKAVLVSNQMLQSWRKLKPKEDLSAVPAM